jgi:hypothetical protein
MQMFREALSTLQGQIESLDELKVQHYETINEHEEEVWDAVQVKVCLRFGGVYVLVYSASLGLPSRTVNDGRLRPLHRQGVRSFNPATLTHY